MLDSNLPVFISVAESGSFSQAALRLGKSPQAVFKQITTYEEKLGVKLFDRSPTGMRLTPAGISVYKDAKFLLSFLDFSHYFRWLFANFRECSLIS